ncbi:MAG: proprotein convertase P-domain-containing protein, partial [Ferruginibacter sp.]|nr:proprotein convertase P-domain-containing protein [Ferruginibacter sp.]
MRIFTTIILLAFSVFARAQSFTWTGYQHIDDNSTYTIPINVSGLQSTIDNGFGVAHICLNITHSYDADLTIRLQSPNGLIVTLIENIGGAGNNFSGTCLGMDGVAFTAAQAPYTGIFFPVGETSSFNNGQNPNGTWLLTVTDVSAPDTGSIHSAYIEFTNNPPAVNGTPGPPVGTYNCGTCSCPGGIQGCDLLPDMTSSYKEINLNHTEQPGVLFISNATPNIGSGPLDIYGIDSCFCNGVHVPCGTICPNGEQIKHVVKQRIYQKVPGQNLLTFYDRFAGKMSFHPTHGHLHVDNWANYTLRTATSNPDARTWPIVASGTKQSFCLINLGNCATNPGECVDNAGNTILTVPNSNLGWHNGCGLYQGIYPGNYDVYSENLNDPMPLINVCNGNYYIVSITDPDNNFLESDETNNWVAVPITLTQQNVAPAIAATGSTTFCQGSSVILTSSPASNYLWSTGETSQSIIVTTAGTFSVSTTCGTAVVNSNSISTVLIPLNSAAGVAISITNGNNPGCPGVYLVFSAAGVNGGNLPSYQWKINGVNAGTNSPAFSSASLVNGDVVSCTLTSNISCLTNPSAVSNSITMVIATAVDPNVSISQSTGTNPTCQGNNVSFTAAISGLSNPVYQWKLNGANVGTNSNVYSSTTFTNGQNIRCEVLASASCPVTGTIGTATTINDYRSDLGAAYPTYYGSGR